MDPVSSDQEPETPSPGLIRLLTIIFWIAAVFLFGAAVGAGSWVLAVIGAVPAVCGVLTFRLRRATA